MKLIRQIKDNDGEGLAKGDVREVDERSAKILIDRGDAEAYSPPEPGTDEAKAEETIDDIVDPEVARNRRQMTATIVGGPSRGPNPAVAVEVADPDPLTATPDAVSHSGGKAGTADKAGKGADSGAAAPGLNPAGGAGGGGGQ